MTIEQKKLLAKLELALADLVHRGNMHAAKALGKIVEWLQKDEPVIAMLEAENIGFDERMIRVLQETYDVKKW